MRTRRRNKPIEVANSLITSRLLPELFAGYEQGEQLTVLDLGPGNANTLDFLYHFQTKVFFADLLAHPIPAAADENTDSTVIDNCVKKQLAIPDGTHVDICLLWDYLHYIDLPTIEALSRVLHPMFHKNTRGYGFGTLHGKQPKDTNQYGIAGLSELVARPTLAQPQYFAHSQHGLNTHFLALRIARSTLLREGRLELLFEAP